MVTLAGTIQRLYLPAYTIIFVQSSPVTIHQAMPILKNALENKKPRNASRLKSVFFKKFVPTERTHTFASQT